MNRRSLLAFIGLAPIAGVAAALPRPADPVKLAGTTGREIKAVVGECGPEAIMPVQPFVFVEGKLYFNKARINDLYR
ncbi:hypothetical protein FHS21_001323 [Phyllobacterium trifolii]|uniref:Uncharacterized protein n=1 Tax=Phyllobacterium trifolii TaxID=300193 RepID=A0A839U7F9_9HYPH|nr:hypothetical protein [Phyllobacterium trifolii]MBB3144922.1 hypothetical protein [Phyllobacterium trifolii]